MSVFRGSITEYPGVIVDHFVPSNCDRGRAFFLSHCHRDHMTGLSSPALFHALQRRQTSLFCSEVTRSLLLKDPEFSSLSPFLKPLPMEYPVAMALDALHDLPPLTFTVTLLPAGHCPGSAMFLFQGSSGNVLYTGDFRLTLEETQRLQPLHSNGSLIELASVYLDTTFCHPSASKLPSRAVSRDHVIKIMERWLSSDERNVVRLHCPSFGYEHIFMGVASRLRTKVHIARWKIQAYADLPAVSECLTLDGDSTRVHNCSFRRGVAKRRGGLPCGSRPVQGAPQVLHIKPSTLWFLSNSRPLSEPTVFFPEYNSHRVLHSMHASYTEVCQFVSYLQPRRVVPCVVPVGDACLTDVHGRLKALLPHSHITSDLILGTAADSAPSLPRPQRKGQSGGGAHSLIEDEGGVDYDEDSSLDEAPHVAKLAPFSSASSSSSFPSLPGERLALPSMMNSHAPSSGVIAPPVASAHAPRGSCDGVGSSLEQTSLDLSLDGSESSAAVGTETGPCGSGKSETEEVGAGAVDTCEGGTGSAGGDSPLGGGVDAERTADARTGPRSTDSKAMACPGDGRRDTPTEDLLPPHKRLKLSSRGADSTHATSADATPVRRLFQGDCEASEHIQYIDLTLEDSSDESSVDIDALLNMADWHIPNKAHHTPIKDHQSKDRSPPTTVVVLSSSSGSSQCEEGSPSNNSEQYSPDILPPTPGREEVDSILRRKKLTVL